MSLLKTSALVGALALITKVSAHGVVSGVVADGAWYEGYQSWFPASKKTAGWLTNDMDRGFVGPESYSSPDIICHKDATPGALYITVTAGSTMELQWTEWPESHHGPMLDYLAPCGEDCTTVDKTKLQFTKIDEAGLNSGPAPGNWASDDLIANNNTWDVTIPSSIAPGKYVLRHETIALHSANNENGAQNYPQCMNIEVVGGSGTNDLSSGTLATDFYTPTDPGILKNIYWDLTDYTIPGPPLMAGGSSGSPSVTASASASASASMPADISVTATPTTGIAIPTKGEPSSAPYSNSTAIIPSGSSNMSSSWVDWSLTATATPKTGIAIPSDVPADVETSTSAAMPSSMTTEKPAGPTGKPAGPTSEVPSPEEKPTTTAPVSFSSTVTGRVGKPTKFVCYVEED